jgi:hypothetical protein
MDLVDLTKEINLLNSTTLPLLHKEIEGLVNSLHELIDRLNQAQATITFTLPERKT